MEITYLGHSSFKIKGKTASIITDPYFSESVGFHFPKSQSDIVTVSHNHKDHSASGLVEGDPFVIDFPGEYEIKGTSIFGYPSFHDASSGEKRGNNIIYLIEIENIKICHLGDLGCLPSTKILDEISVADILMIPVGGIMTIGFKEAHEIIKQIEPFVILPMHFKTEDIKQETFSKLSTLDDFLKEMGGENTEKLEKLIITKEKLPEETKIVVLERKD